MHYESARFLADKALVSLRREQAQKLSYLYPGVDLDGAMGRTRSMSAQRMAATQAGRPLVYLLSLKLMSLGARLVQFGLPSYEPDASAAVAARH
jgi:hypothetical protein